MLPSKEDPRWQEIVQSQNDLPVEALATKMVLTRARLLVLNNNSPEKIDEAVGIIYDFFKKNENIVINDIKRLFS